MKRLLLLLLAACVLASAAFAEVPDLTDDTYDGIEAGMGGTVVLREDMHASATVGDRFQIVVPNRTIKSCKSSREKIASVTDDGRVEALSAGAAKITVKCRGGKKLKLTLTVEDPSIPTSVTIEQGATAVMGVGETLQLTCVLSPKGAKSRVKWKSSAKKVASVDSDGLVTAKKTGQATITATTSRGHRKAKIVIEVTDAPAPTPEPTPAPTPEPAALTADIPAPPVVEAVARIELYSCLLADMAQAAAAFGLAPVGVEPSSAYANACFALSPSGDGATVGAIRLFADPDARYSLNGFTLGMTPEAFTKRIAATELRLEKTAASADETTHTYAAGPYDMRFTFRDGALAEIAAGYRPATPDDTTGARHDTDA